MELIKIYQGNLVDARELHQFLEIRSPFRNWAQRSITNQFVEKKDFHAKMHESNKGRPSKEYYLTINTAKKLAMMAKTTKGKEARDYFLACEKIILNLRQNKRLEAFVKLEATKAKFKNNILDLGGNENDYIQIDYKSRKVFFNGEPLQDEVLNTVLMKGRDLAIEMTNGNILAEKVKNIGEA